MESRNPLPPLVITRRGMLAGAAALGALGYAGRLRADVAVAAPPDAAPWRYIGAGTPRIDGRAKVTGAAKYAAEVAPAGLAHASVVGATIAKGRLLRIDAEAALRVEGVIAVITHENRPPMADDDAAYKDDAAPEQGSPFRPLYDDRIHFNGQPVALVVAETWEAAQYAASLVRLECQEEAHATDLQAQRSQGGVVHLDTARGDFAAAFAAAPVRHEAEYFVPVEHHNPMELFAATAVWEEGGRLTVYDKTQGVQNVQRYLRGALRLEPAEVRVLSPFVGGAFGVGLRPQYQALLAAMAARTLRRPVRLVLTRAQMYTLGHRPATIERLALGARADGTLEAVSHEAIAMTSRQEHFARNDTTWSALLYKSASARYLHRLVSLDLPTACDMRAPGAATGVYALECAMDELAVALRLDPLELRRRTYSERDQGEDLPYTSKALHACYEQGAAAFGWSGRDPAPRAMRDGGDLVGWGMATGVWEALQMPMAARVVLAADGSAEVACATSDIGTGTYTIMAQLTAEMLGMPIERVAVKLGDSTLPQAPLEGGSWTAASVSIAIGEATAAVRRELLRLAQAMPGSALAGAAPEQVTLADGALLRRDDPARSVPVADVMRQAGIESIAQEVTSTPAQDNAHARNTHSAIFAEVKVDEQLGVIRVTRVVNAVAAGRILNSRTAHSQIMGSVVWGIGMALHEETTYDHRFGRVMNANIAEYHVPTNADVHDIDVIFVEEPDALINPLGVKGIGEIGIVGVAAAIANAVYHATGTRVRDLPITLDKLQRGVRRT